MAGGLALRVAQWYIRSQAEGGDAGRLWYVDGEGRVVDLGVYTRGELITLAWAHGVAYRTSSREERSRLSRTKAAAARLARGVAALSSEKKVQ